MIKKVLQFLQQVVKFLNIATLINATINGLISEFMEHFSRFK